MNQVGPDDDIFCAADDTGLTVEDAVLRDSLGRGVEAARGSKIDLRRVLLERNLGTGLYLGMHTDDQLQDVVVRETEATDQAGQGTGVAITGGAYARLERVLLERNHGTDLLITDNWALGTRAELRDLTLLDGACLPHEEGEPSTAAITIAGASVEASRVLLDRVAPRGLVVLASSPQVEEIPVSLARVRVEDLTVRAIDGCDAFDGGYALLMGAGSTVEVSRASIEEAQVTAIAVSDRESSLVLNDLRVRDTLCNHASGLYGRGLEVMMGASVRISRGVFERNHGVSVLAISPETTIEMSDIVIADTLPQDCVERACDDSGGGNGVVSLGGARIALDLFRITGSILCGVQLAYGFIYDQEGNISSFEEGGAADLREGEIANNLIGANIQTRDFDISRLMDRVAYYDNSRNLDTDDLPIPSVGLNGLTGE
jgi:hypothetical protein